MGEGSVLGFAVLFDSRVSRVPYFLMIKSKDININSYFNLFWEIGGIKKSI